MAPEDSDGEAGNRTILVVDDEEDLLEAIRRVLTRRGHTVLRAGSVDEAMKICRAHDGRIDLLLTDLRMPGGGGEELAHQARQQRPDLAVLFMSGLADSSGLATGQVDGPIVG